jgi:NADH-quinone oxidoreductase subunit J
MEWVVFVLGALIVALGAFGVVTRANPVHAALSLVGTLFGIAVLFIAQDAEFLAAVQVIVYAGAIVVLFLFVIMLLGVDTSEDLEVEPLTGQRTAAVVAGGVLALGLIAVLSFGTITGDHSTASRLDGTVVAGQSVDPITGAKVTEADAKHAPASNPVAIGRRLFTDYLWAFEITSVLLVIAVVGAVTLARHRVVPFEDDDLPGDDLTAESDDDDADPDIAHPAEIEEVAP